MPNPPDATTETLDTGLGEVFDVGTAHNLELDTVHDLDELEFPSSDGVAMAESDFQAHALVNARHFLFTHFKSRHDVYISGNIFVYYDPDSSRMSVSPDILVAFGIPRRKRKVYKTWVEGKVPDFVLEVLSTSTARRDSEEKRDTYAHLGVREFFLFDPSGTLITPPLQGYELVWKQYERLPGTGIMAVRSKLLGLDLWVDEERDLRMRDIRTGINLNSPEESETGRIVAEEQAEQQMERARRAKERSKQEGERAERQRERAKEAAQAVRERARAERAVARARRETERAERERMRADEEARIRRSIEVRLAELESRLHPNQ